MFSPTIDLPSGRDALPEVREYPEGILQFETSDPVMAGPDGVDNFALTQLAARTAYLRTNGIPPYGAKIDYLVGDYTKSANGKIYRATSSSIDKDPSLAVNNTGPLAVWSYCPMTEAEIKASVSSSLLPVSYTEQTPTAEQRDQALANLGLIDLVKGSDQKNSARFVITNAAVPLTGLPASVNCDGATPLHGDRVLRAVSPPDKNNGPWNLNSAGAWVRTIDANENVEVTSGMKIAIEEGALYKDSEWMLLSDGPIVVGTTALLFEIVGGKPAVLLGGTLDSGGWLGAGTRAGISADLQDSNRYIGDLNDLVLPGEYYFAASSTINTAPTEPLRVAKHMPTLHGLIKVWRENEGKIIYQLVQAMSGLAIRFRAVQGDPAGWSSWQYPLMNTKSQIFSGSANGYSSLAGDIVMQWGFATGASGNDTIVSLPLAYSGGMINVFTTCDYTMNSGQIGYVASTPLNNAQFVARSSGNFSTRYIAFGRMV